MVNMHGGCSCSCCSSSHENCLEVRSPLSGTGKIDQGAQVSFDLAVQTRDRNMLNMKLPASFFFPASHHSSSQLANSLMDCGLFPRPEFPAACTTRQTEGRASGNLNVFICSSLNCCWMPLRAQLLRRNSSWQIPVVARRHRHQNIRQKSMNTSTHASIF